jgi:hypothetical protein
MESLHQQDLFWCVKRLPKKLYDALKKRGNKVVVAGGYIRSCISNERINDIDLFCPNVHEAEMMALSLTGTGIKLIKTDNAYTIIGLRDIIQIIHRWTFEKPEDIIPSFDFTVASSAFYWDIEKEEWKSVCDPSFYPDLAAKRLVYRAPIRNEDAGGSMLRVLKFYQRGYRIPLDSLGRVMGRMLAGVPVVNFEKRAAFQDAPEGWEAQMSHVLTGLLHEVDPQIDPDHISHLPDQGKF